MPPLQVAASQQISENVTSLAKQQRARILPPFLAGGGGGGTERRETFSGARL